MTKARVLIDTLATAIRVHDVIATAETYDALKKARKAIRKAIRKK